MFTSYLNRADLPRGLRNNNPGNLVITAIAWQGKIAISQNKDGRFEQFIDIRHGIRAMMRDIINDYNKGKRTVTAIISEFAPAFENNTQGYINTVVNAIGGDVISELTEEKLIAICKAIVKVENGTKYQHLVSEKDYADALNILGIKLKKKVAISSSRC